MEQGERKLTAKQQRFVEEYLIDCNGTQAAIRAGYSQHTANEIAAQNLAKVSIKKAIEEGRQKQTERAELTADWVLARLQSEAELYGPGASHAARIKALELLGKHKGLFSVDAMKFLESVLGAFDARAAEQVRAGMRQTLPARVPAVPSENGHSSNGQH